MKWFSIKEQLPPIGQEIWVKVKNPDPGDKNPVIAYLSSSGFFYEKQYNTPVPGVTHWSTKEE